jgi:ketosteroid isomerase-like protein
MDREALSRWVEAYERAWRSPGVEALDALFTEDATYSTAPFATPFARLPAIREMWERGRSPGERFEMSSEVVAVEGDVGVVRVWVHYTRPRDQVYRDLWIVRLAADGRCAAFEEWPFWPKGSGGGYDPGPAAS